ncbi:MAG: chorismate synthase [Clostridia bacterium]|nr:chorismate synthase [Clostridia bacterium]
MSCSFGEKVKVTIFGQSHSEAIGVVIDGLPAGKKLDFEQIEKFMSRRAPGKNKFSTARKEADLPKIISGIADGVTCGAPLCAVIENGDTRSKDYENLRAVPRPAHSDFAAFFKHNGFNDIRGGGNFSGRMTAPLCFAGAVCMQFLQDDGIEIGAHIEKIAGIKDERYDSVNVDFKNVKEKEFPVLDDKQGEKMREKIEQARLDADSVGGVIECAVTGLPVGLGEPMFGGVENVISQAVFAVPAVKGIEFGSGFDGSDLKGSENNDAFSLSEGKFVTETNNHGGILGGISSSMPVIFRVAMKPTPSIGKTQKSVNLITREETEVCVHGRHDPCVVPRAVPCIEAAAAIAIMNLR